MMLLNYLKPLPSSFDKLNYKSEQLGYRINKNIQGKSLPDLDDADIALFSIKSKEDSNYLFRKEFYTLFMGNWSKNLVDIGDIIASEQEADTLCGVKELCKYLIQEGIVPLFIGSDQSLLLAMYQAFEDEEQFINLLSVDAKFDLGNEKHLICPDSYMSRIISEYPTYLQKFINLGYQSYYVSQEELDLMNDMLFEAHRLGSFDLDIELAEPIVRNSDLANIDMSCVQARDVGLSNGYPNGFSNREICNIARYIGLSRSQCMAVFNLPDTPLGYALSAQVVWYLLEGFNFRVMEYPCENDDNYIKYNVPIDSYVIQFFKSKLTERWWIRPYYKEGDKIITSDLIPSTEKQYQATVKGEIPQSWWDSYKLYN